MKPRLLFYCQHVLGMGHVVRSREIVKGLTAFEVCFVNGGESVQDFGFPAGIGMEQLPPIAADTEFQAIHAVDGRSLDELQNERRTALLRIFDRFQPDVIVIEMFPFGRRKFAFELVPLLEAAAARGTRVVSSVRDILVSKRDQARHDAQAVDLLNRYFHLVLVHADPRFQTLEETFTRAGDLRCRVQYTGFVAEPSSPPAAGGRGARMIASAGGGRVGWPLLRAAVEASLDLGPTAPLQVFTGPYLPEAEYEEARRLAARASWIEVDRFAVDFVSRLAHADLLIGMAGYNTCMNILATGVRALVHPFTGNGNQEQTLRARKLEQLGMLGVLTDDDLAGGRLTNRMNRALSSPRAPAVPLDLSGVARTAACLEELAVYA